MAVADLSRELKELSCRHEKAVVCFACNASIKLLRTARFSVLK